MTPIALVSLLNLVPQLISAGMSMAESWKMIKTKADLFIKEKRDPRPDEWADLNAQIQALRDELHAP